MGSGQLWKIVLLETVDEGKDLGFTEKKLLLSLAV